MTLSKENQQKIRANYETWVIHHLEVIGKMNTGDAQNLLEANEGIFEHSRHIGLTHEQTAKKILEVSVAK